MHLQEVTSIGSRHRPATPPINGRKDDNDLCSALIEHGPYGFEVFILVS